MHGHSFEERFVFQGFGKIRYIRPVCFEDADGLVEETYRQLSREFLFLPPAVLHSPIPQLLAGAWIILRETLLTGSVPRMLKEAVAVGVSEANSCPYGVESHTLMLREAGAGTDDIMIRSQHSRVAALIDWAGYCPGRNPSALVQAPFGQRQVPEIIGTAVGVHYFNRIANVFLDQSPLPLPSALHWARNIFERLAARSFGNRVDDTPGPPGVSLSLLPPADLPTDFQWARTNGVVAGAFARMAHVIEDVGSTFVPGKIRAFISDRLVRWNGEPLPRERGWATSAVQCLEEVDRPLATLLLLTILASNRVDARVVAAALASFGARENADRALLGAVAWAAFCGARRASTWLQWSNTAFDPALTFSLT